MPASLSGTEGRFRNTSSGREYVVHRFDVRCRMYDAPEVTDFTTPPDWFERAAGRQEYHGNLVMSNVDPIYDVRPGERGLFTVSYQGTGAGFTLPIYIERLETRPIVDGSVAAEVSFISDGAPSEYRVGAIIPNEVRARQIHEQRQEAIRQSVNRAVLQEADQQLGTLAGIPVVRATPSSVTISASTPPGTNVRMEGSNDGTTWVPLPDGNVTTARYVRPVYTRDMANSSPSRRLTTAEEIEDFHRLRRARNEEIYNLANQAVRRGLLSSAGVERIMRERSEYLGRLFAHDYSRESMVAYDLWAVTTYNGLWELLAGRGNAPAEAQQAQPTSRRRRAFHVNGPVTVEG